MHCALLRYGYPANTRIAHGCYLQRNQAGYGLTGKAQRQADVEMPVQFGLLAFKL